MSRQKQIGSPSALDCLSRRLRAPFARNNSYLPLKAGGKCDTSCKSADIRRILNIISQWYTTMHM